MENNQLPGQQPNSAAGEFVKKPVEMPILDSGLRQQIRGAASSGGSGGFKDFYRANKLYFYAFFIGAALIAVLSYLAFKKPAATAPKEANVDISVDVPQTAASGGEAVYKINLKNNDSQKLVSGELELVYPEGIVYLNSVPQAENLSGSKFAVPDLASGQNASVIVKTRVNGNVNDEKRLGVKFHYRFGNFNSEFIKEQYASIRLVAADVLVELQGPDNVNNAQIAVYTVRYQNNSDEDVKNARIKMNYPEGFVYASASPAPDVGNDTWNLGTLAKSGSGQIQIQGSFSAANPGESKTAAADFVVLDAGGQAQVQNSSSFTTAINSSPLLAEQSLEPGRDNNVIKPGENLNFKIRYQNNSSVAATGVNIMVTLDSRAVNWSAIRAEGGQVNNNTILWNASLVSNLESLAPNESGQLGFSLQINNPAVKDSSKNLTLVSSIKIRSNETQTYFPGNTLSLKVSSPSSISTDLNFVSGQLPPQVGKSSIYKVKLSLINATNDYSDGMLTAFLPISGGALVSGSVSVAEAANVQFDSSTGKLSWNVGSVPANTGRFSRPRSLEFQIKLNPSASQAYSLPVLARQINFSAKDVFTGQDINILADNITTNDLTGSGYGNGTVQP